MLNLQCLLKRYLTIFARFFAVFCVNWPDILLGLATLQQSSENGRTKW